jgi:hypothetical protein
MKKIIFGLFLLLSLSFKCGPFYKAQIYNSLDQDVIAEIMLEKEAIEIYKENPYQPLFEIDKERGVETLSFDSITSVLKIKIPSQANFEIDFGNGREPEFDLIKEIRIIAPDTLVLKNKKEMKKAFVESKNQSGTFVLTIK